MDNLDKFLLLRRILINRKDCLNNTRCLYVLSVLRNFSGINTVTIHITLKKIKRSLAYKYIYESLETLISCAYVRQSSGKGSLYYITHEGLQALKDFNDSIECADYVNYNKKPPISKKVKRPGL